MRVFTDDDYLGIPRASNPITVSGTSARVAFGAGIRFVSLRAVGADIRFKMGDSTVTATTSDHFIAEGERLDFRVGPHTHIAAIRNASTSGTLEISEYAL